MSDQVIEQPKSSNLRPYLIGAFVVLVLATGVVLFFIFSALLETPDTRALPTLSEGSNGVTLITPPRTVNDFTLTSHTGDPLALSDLRGKPVLLYFGYTHCPDVCPLTLMEFRQVRSILGEQGDDVHFVFISVDGERDNPEWISRYFEVRSVEDFMIGLTGTEAEMKKLGVDYGLYFEKREDPGTAANYLVDHTASSFLIDAEGRLSTIFSFGTAAQTIAETLQADL